MRGIVKVFVIGVLGLAGLLVPVGYVGALDNYESCRKQGFILCEDGKCGSRKCTCNGKDINPADNCYINAGGKLYTYSCDGCSGKLTWLPIRPPKGTLPQLTPSVPPSRQRAPIAPLQK